MLRPFDKGFNKWYDTPILSGIEVIAAQMQIILVCKTQHSFPPKLLN